MLPYRKPQPDSQLKSHPISRINSTSRLNQLPNQPGTTATTASATAAVPPTSSSLNPSRNLPTTQGNIKSKIRTKEDLDKFENLPIVVKVNEFETLLNGIADDISKFKDVEIQEKVEQIIQINDILKNKIEDLNKHRDFSYQVDQLTIENKQLETKLKDILRQLITYRNELKGLPRLPKGVPSSNNVEVDEILKYAMRLAKFTKAPAIMASMPLQIHPNNYIWPAEDALRRGVLAVSSLQGDEIIKQELGEEVKQEDVVMKDEDSEIVKEETTKEEIIPRRGSFGYGTITKKKEETSTDLNLDLFDPDDEYSD
ncbi:Mediator of RNA polymerase II transcription subunit 4 [Spathaspora sp. JA1]|nr:Mediator of RNA polymerase II transcription subunit 4 [Spathaspora sp. JA1]